MNATLPQDYKEKFDRDGFVVVKNVLTPEECAHYKALLEEANQKYRPHYFTDGKPATSLHDKSSEKVVYNLHNKHMDFYALMEHPVALEAMDYLLKTGSYMNAEPYYLLNSSARCPLEGTPGQQLHLDSNFPGCHFPLFAIALWMLDDFTAANGATRVVPGSHRRTGYAADGAKYDDEILAEAPQGSLLIFNAGLWHGGSDKSCPGTRWAIIMTYGRWFLKPSFDATKSLPPEYWNQLTDSQKDLLGFRSIAPTDEFTRLRRRSATFENPPEYHLPV